MTCLPNLKLHNILAIPKLLKKVITNHDSSMTFGPNCIPVMVLKNFEPELSYVLAELINMCLKESCFPDYWEVLSVVPEVENVMERSTARTTVLLVFFLWLVKSLENL